MRSKFSKSSIVGIVASFGAAQSSVAAPESVPILSLAPSQSEPYITFGDARIVSSALCAFEGRSEPGGGITALVAIENTPIRFKKPGLGLKPEKGNGEILEKQLQKGDAFIAFHEEAFIAIYKSGAAAASPLDLNMLTKSSLEILKKKHKPLLDAMPQIADEMFDLCAGEVKKHLDEKHSHTWDVEHRGRQMVRLQQTSPNPFSFFPPSSTPAPLL